MLTLPRRERSETLRELIVSTLTARIESGEWAKGSQFPSESILCAEFRVARGTMRDALSVLQEMGHLVVVPAQGRYLTHAPDASPREQIRRVSDELKNELLAGIYRPGQQFMSTRDLAARYEISTYSARQVLLQLECLGFLTSAQGVGYFVVEPQMGP